MILNDAKNIMFGNRQVKKVYLGEHLVWPKTSPEPDQPITGFEILLAIESVHGEKTLPHININYLYKSTSKIVLDFERTETDENNYNIFGTTAFTWCVRKNLFSYEQPENPSLLFYNGRSEDYEESTAYGDLIKNGVRYVLTAEKNYCRIAGSAGTVEMSTQYPLIDYNGMTNQANGIYVYGLKIGATDTAPVIGGSDEKEMRYRACAMRIYSCKIYEDGKIVRDLIPVREISTNRVGLYDMANRIFYTKNMVVADNAVDTWYDDYIGIKK